MNNLVNMVSSRTALVGDGGGRDMQSGSRGAFTQYNSSAENSSPAVSSLGRSNLERRSSAAPSLIQRVQQALVDSFALLFCVCFVIVLLLSIPLAIFLLFFAL
jgi:hypothetical protein